MDQLKTADTIIIGGGIIGLTLALALRGRGAGVIVIERSEPGREASHAAAGMLAYCDPHNPAVLRPLMQASARLYPEFVDELEDESGVRIDFRQEGTIAFDADGAPACPEARRLSRDEVRQLDPAVGDLEMRAEFWPEASVDPRTVIAAAIGAAKHRGVDVIHGTNALEVTIERNRAAGIRTDKARFAAATVVNCAGAWAGEVSTGLTPIPTRPVKGQMLSVAPAEKNFLRHVVRAPEVYLVPRSDGRLLIGATVEEAGFDKRVDARTIQQLHHSAVRLIPAVASARILEDWAGLRPGTPDNLPILGPTSLPGYFVAAGHFRDGILLAPITAKVMADTMAGGGCGFDLTPFSPTRFETSVRPLTGRAV
jgi:glycine oxidase